MGTKLFELTTPQQLDDVLSTNDQVVIHFWASWCEPCAHMDAVLLQLAGDFPGACFAKVEAEEVPDISEKFEVAAVPFFVCIKNAKVVDKLEGADAATLTLKVQALCGPSTSKYVSPAPVSQPAPSSTQDVNLRIKSLLASKPVLLFMKGSADQPRCGFSGKVVNALREVGVDFGTFDILQDEEIRQHLKEYSNWPTYPQLYVKGELMGGCDIIMEMSESGELKEALQEALQPKEAMPVSERVAKLVASQPVMLFMKGTPDAPRCGFSRKVVDALKAVGEDFGSFDVLSDEVIRQGVKEFSDWPTFPQLFVQGELVGGCDIVTEMAAAGELKTTIEEMKSRIPAE